MPIYFADAKASLSGACVFFLSTFAGRGRGTDAVPRVAVLITGRPVSGVPTGLVLFSGFLVVVVV